MNSLANLKLHQLSDAEKSGLQAAEEGTNEQKQQAHWLLAIYEEEGNRGLEANQLREYLKLKPQPSQAELARQVLRQIQERQREKK